MDGSLDGSVQAPVAFPVGSNAFRYLNQLQVGEGKARTFSPRRGIETLFVIVSEASGEARVNGTLRVRGDADLVLVVPGGLRFGPAAELSVSGAVVITAATELLFASPSSPELVDLIIPPSVRPADDIRLTRLGLSDARAVRILREDIDPRTGEFLGTGLFGSIEGRFAVAAGNVSFQNAIAFVDGATLELLAVRGGSVEVDLTAARALRPAVVRLGGNVF